MPDVVAKNFLFSIRRFFTVEFACFTPSVQTYQTHYSTILF